jgi:hypothetical protein
MVSVYSKNLQIYTAEAFKHDISADETRIHLTIGRATAWANDQAPPQTNTSVTVFNEIYKNMIGAKLVTGNDVYHVIPRTNWANNTSYAAYDHCQCSLQLYDTANVKFYVVTEDWNVYKCIANNNNGVSTVKPTSISTFGTVTTEDNYTWKFMYQISPAEQLRFTTNEYIPIRSVISNDNSLQWQVQNNTVSGAIHAIKITNAGTGYTSANLTWSGDGVGFNAFASVNATSQIVENIVITNPGQDYTYLDLTIDGDGINANARAIMSPPGGHGSDALYELGGSYLMLNPRIKGTESNYLPVGNDYRQIALINDIKSRITGELLTNTVFSQTTTVPVTGVSDTQFVKDEIAYQGISLAAATFYGTVLDWDSVLNQLTLINTVGTPTQQTIVGATSGAQRFTLSGSITYPEAEKYSGRLLYTDNIKPITRASDQTEDFKIIIKF